MGWEVSFFAVVLNVVITPLRGGGPTLPLWGRVVTFLVVCFVLLCFESCDLASLIIVEATL